jgi:putative holliday junction resolvase
MKILGIDYGRSKVGLAISVSGFSEPLKVVRYSETNTLLREIKKVIQEEGVEKVVVGISEGEMGEESKKFALTLGHLPLHIPVETFDETLTSKDAQTLSRQAGINRKKRHRMEDAYAASIMLQNYLDNVK